MIEGVAVGEKLTNEIFSGVDEGSREDFLTILAQTKSNLIAIEREDV